jgi:hypothetical protein
MDGQFETSPVTIKGKTFNLISPYAAGPHELTEGEASALNQVRHENVRNNCAKGVEEGKLTDEQVLAYDREYEFGVRGIGGPVRDPVTTEARSIAREAIKVRRKEKNMPTLAKEAMDAAIEMVLNGPKGGEIRRLAAERVEAKKATAASLLDDMDLESAA